MRLDVNIYLACMCIYMYNMYVCMCLCVPIALLCIFRLLTEQEIDDRLLAIAEQD